MIADSSAAMDDEEDDDDDDDDDNDSDGDVGLVGWLVRCRVGWM
jgi:hypothetical protein